MRLRWWQVLNRRSKMNNDEIPMTEAVRAFPLWRRPSVAQASSLRLRYGTRDRIETRKLEARATSIG